jgi:hypothetical protein
MGKILKPHPHWKGGLGGGWGDEKCDYCDCAADMTYKGGYACFEHRTSLVKDKSNEEA